MRGTGPRLRWLIIGRRVNHHASSRNAPISRRGEEREREREREREETVLGIDYRHVMGGRAADA